MILIFVSSTEIDSILSYYYNLSTTYRGLVRKMTDDKEVLQKQLRNVQEINFKLTDKIESIVEKVNYIILFIYCYYKIYEIIKIWFRD